MAAIGNSAVAYMSERMFKPSDPDFPTTKLVQDRLRAAGRVDDGPARLVATGAPPAAKTGSSSTQIPAGPSLVLGKASGADVYLDLTALLATRMLIQGSSGAGKSATLRKIVEGAHRHMTVVIVDPEGDFANLAAHIGATTIIGADMPEDGLMAVALAARKHRTPVHLDLTDMNPDVRIRRAAAFFAGLVAAPREEWGHTMLVAIDEAHLLAPHMAASSRDGESRRLGVAALTDLCSRGRKRGICPVVATQRLAKLATSVVSELHNVLIGLNIFDRDIARAADLLGYSYDKAAVMRDLPPGRFFALGRAISKLPTQVDIGPTETVHVGATPTLMQSAGLSVARGRELLNVDSYAGEKTRTGVLAHAGDARGSVRLLDAFLLDPSAAAAARVVSALIPISPNATTASQLAVHLGVGEDIVHTALDLLGSLGTVDTMPRGDNRIARLAGRMRIKMQETTVVGLA